MGKSKKKKGLRSRKPCIRRRLTRKIKKIMLRGGQYIKGFDGKPGEMCSIKSENCNTQY